MIIGVDDNATEVPTVEGGEVEASTARCPSPRTPQVHNLIMDFAGALVKSFNHELSGAALITVVEEVVKLLLSAIRKDGSRTLVDRLTNFLAEILEFFRQREA